MSSTGSSVAWRIFGDEISWLSHADDLRAPRPPRIDPLRGPLGGALWSFSGTAVAVLAWEIWLTDWNRVASTLDLVGTGGALCQLGWSFLETATRGGSVILPAFACCYAAAMAMGRWLARPSKACLFTSVWHLGAHGLVALVLRLNQEGAPEPISMVLPLSIGALWGLWLPAVLPRSR